MKSPFTNGEAFLKREPRTLEFRKDQFEVMYHFYGSESLEEQFTTEETDTLNMNQVYHKYREKYGIPFIDEIKEIREKYGLSAIKMSEVLGLGVNVYRNYEAGEMPSVATGRLIRLAQDPKEFMKLMDMSRNVFEQGEYDKVKKKVKDASSGWAVVEQMWKGSLIGNNSPNLHNGYRVPDLQRIGNMVRFFALNNSPFTTALNKLMFYADFGHFKKYGQSISGVYYKALPKGPVPENYGAIYNHLVNSGFAKIEEKDFGEFVGERFVCDTKMLFEPAENLFTDSELGMLQLVSDKFKNLSTKKIVDISHQEPGWQVNADEQNRISFEYGFSLKNID